MAAFVAPSPPRDAVMPDGTQDVLLVLMAAGAVIAIAYMLRESRRRSDLVPVFVALGAAIAIFYEPLGDSLVMAYYPEVGQTTWIDVFGREIPAFIGLLYFWYFCPFMIGFGRLADRGFTTRRWWGLWASTFLFASAFEMVWMSFDNPWLYYGDQPLVVLDLPLWVPFTYVTFLFVCASGVHAIAKYFPRGRQWLIVPAIPCLLVAGHAAASLPGAVALYSTSDSTLIFIGTTLSMALAVLISWTLSTLFVRDDPPPVAAAAPADVAVGEPAAEGVLAGSR